MHSPVSVRKTVPPVEPSGHLAKAQWPVSSTVFPCGQMHAPIISSPSRHGAGARQLPSFPSTCPAGQPAATQSPWASRISLSPQLAVGGGTAEAEATGEGASVADGAGAGGGASVLTAGGAGAPAHAQAKASHAASGVPDRPARKGSWPRMGPL
jgi:hypothetical protein